MNSTLKRFLIYFLGLFIMTIGVGLSVKSNLGVSPVSSIPYTMTLIWGIEMGRATILFYIVLVLLQVFILRRDFKVLSLLQVVIAIAFGSFTTFSNNLISYIPDSSNYFVRLALLVISIIFVAVGILLYMSSNLTPLAGEGVMKCISTKYKVEFSKCKICFDISMVIISVVTCYLFLNELGSVREGTIISAVCVGLVLKILSKLYKEKINEFLYEKEQELSFSEN